MRRSVIALMAASVLLGMFVIASPPPGVSGAEGSPDRVVRRAECGSLDTLERAGGQDSCTHGDDAGLRTRFATSADHAGTSADRLPVACDGDGVSGERVQMIYAHSKQRPSRYVEVLDDLQEYAHGIDIVARASANQTGGDFVFRWVTSRDCRFDIVEAALSERAVNGANGVQPFRDTISELEAQGHTNPLRKYLVFVDGTGIGCGIGESFLDYDPSPATNINNGHASNGMFARVDVNCWSSNVGAHELMHTLGAVLEEAPNATPFGHCTDEWDVMCYADGGGVMRDVCGDTKLEDVFDCNNDDYFNVNPPAGSFLATNWNTARSSFFATPTLAAPDSAVVGATSALTPVSPQRVLDTRKAIGVSTKKALAPGAAVQLSLDGVGDLPASGITGVVLNVTVTQAAGRGYVAVWPAGTNQPAVSNLNTDGPGHTVANQVIVAVPPSGDIRLRTSMGGHLVADVTGYFAAAEKSRAGRFTGVNPSRLLDTRPSGIKVSPTAPVELTINGRGGVPANGVAAVALNLTVTETEGPGFVVAYPSGQRRPEASNLNMERSRQTRANHVIVPVGANGKVTLFSSSPSALIADVIGWYGNASQPLARSGLFRPITPLRAYDSRQHGGLVEPQRRWEIPASGLGGLPAEADNGVLIVNVTAVDTRSSGYFTVHPGDTTRPTASTLNWERDGQLVPNLATVRSSKGRIRVYSHQPAHLLVDVSGYYLP